MKLLNFTLENKAMKFIMLFIYFSINLLFLIKYGIRQDKIPLPILIAVFLIFHAVIYKAGNLNRVEIRIKKNYSYIFIMIMVIVFTIFSHLIDSPYKVNIDRWQTIEYCLRDWMHGTFFYDKPNFIGQMPSYLPGQLLIASFFYLLGNVGYLQVAAFIIFTLSILYMFRNRNVQIVGIFLISIALSFVYDVICKSDFISSFIFIAAFIIFWHKKFQTDYFAKSFLLGIILGILCLTRSLVIIPLILFLLKPFIKTKTKNKVILLAGFSLSFSILAATVVLPVKNIDYLLQYNPLKTQGQGNVWVMCFFIAITVFIASYIRNIRQVFFCSAILYFLLISCFLVESALSGISYNFLGITYMAAALPFSIVGYCFSISDHKEDYQIL